MQRTIQKITQQFVDRLPENEQYYRVSDLRSWGFPSFIVQRIQIELERNLAESMIIPKTDWANTESNAVLDAWQKFVGAIRAEARLPASYGKTVIETAVADVVEILVQPRKNIPSVIFGTEDELGKEEIHDRLKAVVVYRHFVRLIPRYMQKKELDNITRERCAKIVTNADKKLTAGYSPLNWAQMLEPLFRLVDGEIDTNLLRLFYEDKNMPRIARKFDLMNNSLSRAEFIEVLSSPELLDFDGYESGQSALFEDQPPSDWNKQSEKKQQEEKEEPEPPANKEENSEEKRPEENEDSEIPDKEQISAMLFPDEKGSAGDELDDAGSDTEPEDKTVAEEEKATEEDTALNKNFSSEETQPEDEEEDESLNAAFRSENENGSGDRKRASSRGQGKEAASSGDEEQKRSEEKNSRENGRKEASEKEEETPMWMRFMSDEEIEEYKKEQEKIDEDGFIDDPIIDLTEEGTSDREIEALRTLLETDRELFVEKIFRGSERAFDEAVENIAGYKNWRKVSKYIEKNVFKRNLVDMYSEAAVDFTDRLQTYFLEKQKQNK